MPSKSAAQHRLMVAVAHNPEFAKKVGIPTSVGKDFSEADKGRKFRIGGLPASINKQNTRHGKVDMPFSSLRRFAGYKRGGEMKESKAMVKKEVEFFKKKGAPASMVKHEEAEMKGMKRGGMTMRPKKDIARDQMAMAPYARGGGVESRGKTKGKMVRMAGGGYVRSADGVASKGKTKGRMC